MIKVTANSKCKNSLVKINLICYLFYRTEKSMQDYEETQELNSIAPEKPPSPDYPPEVGALC